jgi:hypothetical protein
MRPDSPTGLYWSIRGAVRCREHIQEIDDAHWEVERWAPVPERSQGFRGRYYQCEPCSQGRAVIVTRTEAADGPPRRGKKR